MANRELGIRALMELERRKCARDPKYFLAHQVRTLDQTDKANPIKRFPSPKTMPHPYYLADVWQKQPLLLVPKSRRMLCSWTFVGLYAWDTAFFTGRHNFIGSKKEDDAGELLDRAEFILDPLASKGLVPKFKRRNKPHEIVFPDINSKLSGIASGPDQLRQFTASGVLLDEAAFHEKLDQTLMAAAPTILGGGRMTLISSVNAGSYMERMVFGEAEDLEEAA